MSENEEQIKKSEHRPAHFKVPLDELPDVQAEGPLDTPVSPEAPAEDILDPFDSPGTVANQLLDPLASSGATAEDPLDPFVSSEDPYPYASETDATDAGKIGPDDTADFLAAALASKSALANRGSYGTSPTDTSVYYDVERYRQSRKQTDRHRGLIIALTAFFLVLAGIGIAVATFVSNIDSRLTKDVTPELREQLTPTEPGDPFYLLLLGVDKDQSRWEGDDSEDYGADEHNYRSDSIMLCRIDPKDVKVTMVSVHRDTLIDLGSYGKQKINAAYSFGGPAYTTEVVSEFAGVPISHYAEVDLDRFISIVDQVGGVTVNLPVPVYDPEYTELDLPAGEQTLNGRDAALLCRCRHGYDAYGDGDRFRAANQRMVFSEIIKKVLNSDPATIAGTITTMADSVTTDMTVASILELAAQMKDLDVNTDIMTGMEPTDGVLINDGWYEICIQDEWEKMMKRVDQGLSPYDESEGEYDSTAGIAGGVGEEGKRQAEAAIAADRQEAIDQGLA